MSNLAKDNKIDKILFLKYKAYKLREWSLKMTTAAGSGHLTTALSAADVISVLFFDIMKYNLQNPFDENNDRFILSKGHGIPVIYAAYKELGVLSEKEILLYRNVNSVLEGHPTPRFVYNEAATGSLGQGLSIGLGMAFAAKLLNKDYYTFVMLGDSEMSEGSVWEAIEIAAYYKVENLIAIVDFNRLGQSTETMDDHDTKRHEKKWQGFGWNTIVINGHNIEEIINAFEIAKSNKSKPNVIIAKTYKGYGLDLTEDEPGYHGKAMPKGKLYELLHNLKFRFSDVSNLNLEVNSIEHKNFIKNSVNNVFLDKNDFKIYLANLDKMATRKAYGQAITLLGKYNNKILSLDAEVKNSTYAEIFENAYPERFLQCFIAEQNMIGMAEGLTLRGFNVFSSTFAAFLTRAHDQIRMAAIGKVPLKIAGTHVGVSIGQDGPSQMGLEDIALAKTLQNSIIFYPADAISTYKLVNLMANYNDGISYIRLTRAETPIIYNSDEDFEIGGCKVLKQSNNDQICIIAAGITLFEALKAYEILKSKNIYVSILDLYCIKPLDYKTIIKLALKSGKKIITVEDHYIQGGIAESIAYCLCSEFDDAIKIYSLAIREIPRSGKPEDLLRLYNIDYQAIVNLAEKILK